MEDDRETGPKENEEELSKGKTTPQSLLLKSAKDAAWLSVS